MGLRISSDYLCTMKSDKKNRILRIREVLYERGATPQYLADSLNVSRQYINNILSERGTASIRVLSRIAMVLNVPLASLFADYKAPYYAVKPFRCPKCQDDFWPGCRCEHSSSTPFDSGQKNTPV